MTIRIFEASRTPIKSFEAVNIAKTIQKVVSNFWILISHDQNIIIIIQIYIQTFLQMVLVVGDITFMWIIRAAE